MVRIKICGMTRPEHAVMAAEAGVDAIGLVFAKSPRQVTISQARSIVAELPPYVSAVGVFVNARAATVIRTVGEVCLSEVQLHGDESPDFVGKLASCRVTKALRVRDRSFIDSVQAFGAAGVEAILLDAHSSKSRGGTGRRFDWDLVAGVREAGALEDAPPLILAGGLTPLNVKSGIRRLRPWGVDVSGGVETEPGVKCGEKIARFVTAVRAAG
ncbi:MAG: phosphoribosylanthranilate isomerase [Phycisphaerales bacterium]|nr:phosphoribosylanthranilate isomerase [Phycisphaerales bacterium]